jgi:hypothetical protein
VLDTVRVCARQIQPPSMVVGAHLHYASSRKAIEQAMCSGKRPAELQQLRPVCIGDAREIAVTEEVRNGAMLALVWAGTGYNVAGSIKPKPLNTSALVQALKASKAPPRIVVVWMKYGAETVAQQLAREMDAASCRLTIVWIKHDPHAKNAMRHVSDTIMPALKMIVDGGRSAARMSQWLDEKLPTGATAGCIGAEPLQPIPWSASCGETVVSAEAECESNLDCLELRKLSIKLLSFDVANFVELSKRVLSDENDGSHCLHVLCRSSDAAAPKPDIERCRAVALSACEALWRSGEFYSVQRVSSAQELATVCEALLTQPENLRRALAWLDMKPADVASVDVELIERVCNEHEGGASFVLTLQAADTAFDAPELFEPFDIKAAQEPKLAASSLHGEIKLIIQNPDEPYTPTNEWLEAFNDLLQNTFEVLCKHNVPIAGLYAIDKVRAPPRPVLMASHSLCC